MVATKELPEPVTFAAGVPEPHCAETEDASASTAAKRENLAIVRKDEEEDKVSER